jgi:HSP20 family protein
MNMLNTNHAMAQMNRLRDELDRVFGIDSAAWNRPSSFPPVNVWEDENHFFLEAELPGMSIEDLEIFVHEGDQLTIKGNRMLPEMEGATLRRRERGHGEFSRTFKLESDVDVEAVSAELKHGVLTVTLPKSEKVKPRKIAINVTSEN